MGGEDEGVRRKTWAKERRSVFTMKGSAARCFSPKCARKLSKCAKKCASLKCQIFYFIFGRFRGGTKINLQKYF